MAEIALNRAFSLGAGQQPPLPPPGPAPITGSVGVVPDLSHLTEAEREIIESVMMRQKKEEEEEAQVLKYFFILLVFLLLMYY